MALRTFVRSAIQRISALAVAYWMRRPRKASRIRTTLSLWLGNRHLQQPFFPTDFVIPSSSHSTEPASLPSLLFEKLNGYLTPYTTIGGVCRG
jgi:hypothetical protein